MDENHRVPGYTTRTIQHATNDGPICTLHYFTKDQRNFFLRNVNVSVCLGSSSKRIIQHHEALALESPTRHTRHQYYWITSLCNPHQSLHYLVHHQQPAIVDICHFDFMALSVLSILTCIRDMHASEQCHLGISLRSFYYQQASTITDWYVGGFDQSHVIGQPEGYGLCLDMYSAPELVKLSGPDYYCHEFSPRPALDSWSLGCVIYELATKNPLFDGFDQLVQLCGNHQALTCHLNKAYERVACIHPSFRVCLENLLKVDPSRRASVQVVLDDWITLNSLDDDVE
ncbi:kinase-like domain-containing protein [Chlamydoabsidia padenii]|nr:kinase-like domain-containing protein [Chlamydoabsidia padenii]